MRTTMNFIIDGHEVTASFSPQEDGDALQRVKQILLSAFTSTKNLTGDDCTFAIPGEKEENDENSINAP